MGRRLTVVQLLPALDAGGVERSTIEIAQALVASGHRAIVVSTGGRLLPELAATGAEHIRLDIGRKSPLVLRHVPALRRLFTQVDADIVHARSRLPAWLARLALRGMPRRPHAVATHFVTTVHGMNSPSRYSAVMVAGERVICVSRSVRDYVCTHYPQVDPRRLRIVPRGIDPLRFQRAARPDRDARAQVARIHPALAGDGPLLLLPGRGTRLKGHADALRLLAGLRGGGLDARLWLPGARETGRGGYLGELDALAVQLGIAHAIALTPPTAQIAQAYAASDLTLQLSRKPESFGRTVIESLAVGCPVLGWDHGGVGELLHELQPQGAIAPFDADALLAAARAMLAQPTPAPATMPYTLDAMKDATLAVYAELAD